MTDICVVNIQPFRLSSLTIISNMKNIKPIVVGSCILVGLLVTTVSSTWPLEAKPTKDTTTAVVSAIKVDRREMLYENLQLGAMGLSKKAFICAMAGYSQLLVDGKIKNPDVLSIIDFSLPSSEKRLFVIDLKNGKLLYNSLVSHGKNSGLEMATVFSNDRNSFKSSLGFYVTGNTYKGKHGYSLRLEGEEDNINDHAKSRGIVMHSAAYVNETLANGRGYIGRSEGCPAVPAAMYKKIIGKIKDGSCLFFYSPDKQYIAQSKLWPHEELDTIQAS